MKERGEKIEMGLSDAKKSNELLQKATLEYDKNTIKLRQISIDAQKELQKDLEQLRAKNLDRIKMDNEQWTKKRIEQMEIDKKALVEGAKNEIVSLVMLATEKLLGAKNDKNFDEKVLQELKDL